MSIPNRPVFRVCSTALALLLLAAPLRAQNRPKIEWERWEGEGTVAAYRNGALLMTLKGEPWIGSFVPASKVSVTGFAKPDVLRPGTVVRLSAEFDRKTGAALEPVSDLAIVTPRPGDRPGIFPDEVIDPTERKKGPPPTTMKLRIFDAVTGVKDKTLFFKKYRVEVDDDATITVDVANPALLSEGDTVKKIKGRRIKGTRGQLVIEEIEAQLSQPLTTRKKTPATAESRAAEEKEDEKKDIFSIAGEEASAKKSAEGGKRKP